VMDVTDIGNSCQTDEDFPQPSRGSDCGTKGITSPFCLNLSKLLVCVCVCGGYWGVWGVCGVCVRCVWGVCLCVYVVCVSVCVCVCATHTLIHKSLFDFVLPHQITFSCTKHSFCSVPVQTGGSSRVRYRTGAQSVVCHNTDWLGQFSGKGRQKETKKLECLSLPGTETGMSMVLLVRNEW
jgi:hypothetical protein